jgi:WD40 repeat protein
MALAFSPDGQTLGVGTTDGVFRMLSHLTVERSRAEPVRRAISGIAWSPDGRRAGCASYTPEVRVFATDTAMVAANLDVLHDVDIATVAYAPTGDWLAGGAVSGAIAIWSARGAIRAELTGHSQAVSAVAFSPDGTRLVSSSLDGTVRVWQLAALTADPVKLVADAAARSGLILSGTEVVPDPSGFLTPLVASGPP